MISKHNIIGLILCLFAILQLGAQPLNKASLGMNISAGDQLLAKKDYYGAIKFYQEAYKESKDMEVYRDMAYCYYQIRDFKRANRYYKRILRDKPEGMHGMYYELGRISKMLGNNDEALSAFRSAMNGPVDSLNWLVKQELKGMKQAQDFRDNPKLSSANAGDVANAKFGEMSPLLLSDTELIFSSIDARRAIELTPKGKKGKKTHAQIYSYQIIDGEESEKLYLESPINNENYNIVHQTTSPDGKYLYYNRIGAKGNNIESSELMMSIKQSDGSWGKPRSLAVPQGWSIRHMSFASFQGKSILFFTANVAGGKGGDDLYYAVLGSDGIGSPTNLGDRINTPGDEWTPFYQNNILYFSSNGWPGMGGFDVFTSKWNGGEWMTAKNMESSINTSVDDFGLKWSPSGDKGVLLSNRPGGHFLKSETCCDDMYLINKKLLALAVEFETFSDKFQLDGVTIEVFENINGDFVSKGKKTAKSYTHFISLDKGKILKFVANRDGHFADSITINTVGIKKDSIFNYSMVLNPLPEESREEVISINQTIRLGNIYYDYDDDKILPDAEKDLSYLLELLNKYDNMVIELSSHTDVRGKGPYNEDLSKRRAKSAKQWLVKEGISPGRIRAIGYGEKKILNHCIEGVDCTDDEHRFNRRTEFKIIEGPQEIIIEKRKLNKKVEKKREITQEYSGAHAFFERMFVDLGTIKRGEQPEMVFRVKNNGRKDLLIEIVTGCECTYITWTESPIKPGEYGEVRAILKSEEKKVNGQHNFDIDVVTNTKKLSHVLEYRAVIKD